MPSRRGRKAAVPRSRRSGSSNSLKEWLDKIVPKVLPDSKLGNAVSFTLNQWEYLTRYAEDGRMPIDNNLLERDIRIFATARKSWLFSDTVDGAKASAVVYSLMLACRASRVEPLAWLRHVLTELPSVPTAPIPPTCCPSTSPKPPLPPDPARRFPKSNAERRRQRAGKIALTLNDANLRAYSALAIACPPHASWRTSELAGNALPAKTPK